jgi:hypothetical protein
VLESLVNCYSINDRAVVVAGRSLRQFRFDIGQVCVLFMMGTVALRQVLPP